MPRRKLKVDKATIAGAMGGGFAYLNNKTLNNTNERQPLLGGHLPQQSALILPQYNPPPPPLLYSNPSINDPNRVTSAILDT